MQVVPRDFGRALGGSLAWGDAPHDAHWPARLARVEDAQPVRRVSCMAHLLGERVQKRQALLATSRAGSVHGHAPQPHVTHALVHGCGVWRAQPQSLSC